MNTRLFLPAALAVMTAGAGLLTLPRLAQAQPRQPELRLEQRGGGSLPRLWLNGQEIQAPRGDRSESPDQSMAELLRRLMEMHRNGGPGPGNLDELFRDLNEGSGPDFRRRFQNRNQDQENGPDRQGQEGRLRGQDPGDDEDGSPLNPQRLMEEMMRRMRGGQGGLGFGPGQREEELPRTSKHHLSSLAEWRPLVATARQSTVKVFRRNRQIALATIVSADGYALTKASEVDREKGNIEVGFSDGRVVAASVVDEMKAYDLALIKLEATGLIPAKFADTDTPVGTLIAAVSTEEDPTGIGVISVAARSLDERSRGFLGIQMSRGEMPPKGVKIGEIVEGGAAGRAGLQAGDIILSINAEEITSQRQLQKLVSSLKPDELVKVKLERDGKVLEKEFTLGNRSEASKITGGLDQRQFDQTALMGSNLSRNASGYPNAVQSDLALQAEDAGGPVIDVNGSIVGLNIARAERVSTYLIPGKVLNTLLTDVQSGKFSLAKDADTLNSELREYNAAIQQAHDALKKAEQQRDEARKALERLEQKK